MNHPRLRHYINIIGYCTVMALPVVLFITFFQAMFHDYAVLIYINKYGEAYLESFLLLFSIPYWARLLNVVIEKIDQEKRQIQMEEIP